MKGLLALLLLAFSVSTASADIYTWKDHKGTRFYTNSLHEIPAKYLKRARVLDVATGKIGGLATAQPPAPAQPTAPATARTPLAQPLPSATAQPAASPAPAASPTAAQPAAAAAAVSPQPEPQPQVTTAPASRRPSTFAQRRAARRARMNAADE